MGYKVIHFFTDLQDFNHAYRVGDAFPRQGMKVSEERIAELLGNKNKQGKPLIALKKETVKASEKEEKKTYKKSDIFRMTTAELQALAEKESIENATELTGSELKTILVKHFNL